jgi:crotonobetainyl-CoA:carnitine CoA-transferase CaiB-like acyl-CoA transferase
VPGPLTSLKVLDFTTLLPGPFATMLLADLGADVVRIEAPNRPDLMRVAPPFDGDVSAGHALVNRSKRSVALDLKHAQAADVVQRLVQTYDVVVEGFRPGVMDRLGVGYGALRAANPRVIYVSITGYGQTGPYAGRAGHDLNYLALAGVLSITGREDTGPMPLGLQAADLGGGSLTGLVGLLAAVIHRQQTGAGQHVDVSMLDGTLALNGYNLSHTLAAGQVPGYETEPLNGGSFYGCYATQDGRYLAVGPLEPKFWMGFCEAIGRPDLIEPGMNVWDSDAQQQVRQAVADALVARPLDHWLDVFAAIDVCVEPVLRLDEVADHPQVQTRQMIADVPRPDGTTQRQVAHPLRFSETEATYRHTGAALGAHTADVLREVGFDPDEIDALRDTGAFGDVEMSLEDT